MKAAISSGAAVKVGAGVVGTDVSGSAVDTGSAAGADSITGVASAAGADSAAEEHPTKKIINTKGSKRISFPIPYTSFRNSQLTVGFLL